MRDLGHFNIKGILANAKKGVYGEHHMKPKKYKEHKPTGPALALSKKLLNK